MVLTVNSPVTNPSAINTFISQFQTISRMEFTGCLNVQSTDKWQQELYFYAGRLIWATGETHRNRRWQRCLSQACPQVHSSLRHRPEKSVSQSWEYTILRLLVKQTQIGREQAIAVIEAILAEVLFDILQVAQTEQLSCRASQQRNLDSPLVAVSSQQALNQALKMVNAWSNSGLSNYSPNQAPVVRYPDKLQQSISLRTDETMVGAMNGKATLRDLAVQTRQSLILLAHSLSPYVQKGLIDLIDVPDSTDLPVPGKSSNQPTALSVKPRVVCIDDNKQSCKLVGDILTRSGYQFFSVQDPIQALPTLLEKKPNLILLDLVIPMAKGYEICAQIRKIPAFRQTPIVILTGNDRVTDRVRAKIAGASDFLAKPVEAEKLLPMVQKYVPTHTLRQKG